MKIVGGYEYDEKNEIGRGAFGIVYKGRKRETLDEVVAIKKVDIQNFRLNSLHDSINRETQILQTLSNPSHKNIVSLLHREQQDHLVYFVMPFYNGGNLQEYLKIKQKLEERTIILFLNQIAAGLKAAHDMKIIHRDLKPENILLSFIGARYPSPDNITLKIADFGIGRFLSPPEKAVTNCGTPLYMAPEVYLQRRGGYEFKADLWSVGVIAYECHKGSLPEDLMCLNDFEFPTNITPEFANLLHGLLEKDEKKRFDINQLIYHPFLAVFISLSVLGSEYRTKLMPIKDNKSVDELIDMIWANYNTDSAAAYLIHEDGHRLERGSGNSLRESGIVHNNTFALVLSLSGGSDNEGKLAPDGR